MRKIALTLFALLLIVSCSSSDDDGGGSNISFDKANVTIAGSLKNFNIVVVQESTETIDFGSTQDPALIVSLSSTQNTDEILRFIVTKNEVGANIFDEMTFVDVRNNNYRYSTVLVTCNTCPTDPATITSFVETNTSTRMKGTFSGTLSYFNSETEVYETVDMTGGTFDFEY